MSNLVVDETPSFDLENMVQLFERHVAHAAFALFCRGCVGLRDQKEDEKEGECNEADESAEELRLKVSPSFIVGILVIGTR